MNRRDATKNLLALGIGAFMPLPILLSPQDDKPIHFIGLGTSGSKFLTHFHSKKIAGVYTSIDDYTLGENEKDIQFIEFETPKPGVFSKGSEIDTRFYEEERSYSKQKKKLILNDDIKKILSYNNNFILLSSLGGYTGTYLTEQIMGLLSKTNKQFSIFCTSPFQFEGSKKSDSAKNIINKFGHMPNFNCFEMDNIRFKYGNTTINKAFEYAKEEVYRMYKNYV